jgi:hypothetical protein
MRGVVWIGLAVATLPMAAQGDIFKCVDEHDHITYQDRPCSADALHVPMGSAAVSGMDSASIEAAGRAARLQELRREQVAAERQLEQSLRRLNTASSSSSSYQERLDARNSAVSARARGIVPTGSDVSDAERMLGRPDRRRAYSVSGQNCEHLTWRNSEGRIASSARACGGKVVYFSNQDT